MFAHNGMPRAKSYQELQDDANAHWRQVAQTRATKFQGLMDQILNSPDVKMQPDPDTPWSYPAIACPDCANTTFFVRKWVTCNGIRFRFGAECCSCHAGHTYDWTTGEWIE